LASTEIKQKVTNIPEVLNVISHNLLKPFIHDQFFHLLEVLLFILFLRLFLFVPVNQNILLVLDINGGRRVGESLVAFEFLHAVVDELGVHFGSSLRGLLGLASGGLLLGVGIK